MKAFLRSRSPRFDGSSSSPTRNGRSSAGEGAAHLELSKTWITGYADISVRMRFSPPVIRAGKRLRTVNFWRRPKRTALTSLLRGTRPLPLSKTFQGEGWQLWRSRALNGVSSGTIWGGSWPQSIRQLLALLRWSIAACLRGKR